MFSLVPSTVFSVVPSTVFSVVHSTVFSVGAAEPYLSLVNSKVTCTGAEAFFNQGRFFVPTMVMNYDTY